MADKSAEGHPFSELDKQVQEKKLEVRTFATANRPAVLMFQPTHFVTVSGENLHIYEKLLRERVGLKMAERYGPPEGTISGCTGGCPPWDDCDA
jgi:hypothetical protein